MSISPKDHFAPSEVPLPGYVHGERPNNDLGTRRSQEKAVRWQSNDSQARLSHRGCSCVPLCAPAQYVGLCTIVHDCLAASACKRPTRRLLRIVSRAEGATSPIVSLVPRRLTSPTFPSRFKRTYSSAIAARFCRAVPFYLRPFCRNLRRPLQTIARNLAPRRSKTSKAK